LGIVHILLLDAVFWQFECKAIGTASVSILQFIVVVILQKELNLFLDFFKSLNSFERQLERGVSGVGNTGISDGEEETGCCRKWQIQGGRWY